MKQSQPMKIAVPPKRLARAVPALACCWLAVALVTLTGCGGGKKEKQKDDFFTSGSREADQRASQRMAKEGQLKGSGEGAGEKDRGKGQSGSAEAQIKLSLFERLGGVKGLGAIVDDFTPRVMADPRVNWERKGVKRSGLFGRDKAHPWNPTPENIASLKKHLVQFLALATGGPPQYEGKEMKAAHAGMKVGNPEFDAAIGDLKASLDNLQVPNKEQKELLAIIESTRPQIVTER